MIIPPKLKILAGFKPDEDVTIDMIIAALEKQKLRQKATSISNEKKSGRAGKPAAAADVRERASKFLALMNKREQMLPNESYESRFAEVVSSDEGRQLVAQMERPEIFGNQFSDQEGTGSDQARPGASGAVSDHDVIGSAKARPSASGGDYATKEEARAAFMAHVDRLLASGITRDAAWTTAAATEPGATAYYQWKLLAAAEKPRVIATPPSQPTEAEIEKKRAAMAREN